MIVTVTPNPSLDRTFEVPDLTRGAVLRAHGEQVDPGGKGVNVARALAAMHVPTHPVLPLGGPEGQHLRDLLSRRCLDVTGVPVDGHTRVNISIAEPDGTLTKLNAAGPTLSEVEGKALLDQVAALAADADWVACCGSLPGGLPADFYADLVDVVHRAGARVALDTAGAALDAALPHRPDLVKPNRTELAAAAGLGSPRTVGEVLDAARRLRAAGAAAVLTSLGPDGQLLLDADGAASYGTAPVRSVRSDVGSGDACLAGFLAAGGAGEQALASALAYGAAAVQLPGSQMPTPAQLRPDAVATTSDPPLRRALQEHT